MCVAQITGAHGVRGLVKLKSFTEDPAAAASYGPVATEAGDREFRLHLLSPQRDQWIARIEGVDDRTAAEALAGARLYVRRTSLPEAEEEEFYHVDLIGLAAETKAGEPFGEVVAVHNFGAGDVMELRVAGGDTVMLPFTRAAVPLVDLAAGKIVVDPPEGLLGEPEAAA